MPFLRKPSRVVVGRRCCVVVSILMLVGVLLLSGLMHSQRQPRERPAAVARHPAQATPPIECFGQVVRQFRFITSPIPDHAPAPPHGRPPVVCAQAGCAASTAPPSTRCADGCCLPSHGRRGAPPSCAHCGDTRCHGAAVAPSARTHLSGGLLCDLRDRRLPPPPLSPPHDGIMISRAGPQLSHDTPAARAARPLPPPLARRGGRARRARRPAPARGAHGGRAAGAAPPPYTRRNLTVTRSC